jgi:hypothetical protein
MHSDFLRVVSLCILSLAVGASAQPFFTNGLTAYYPFSGNAEDASGHGYHGTVHDALLTADRFGHPASAYYFNGTNAYIRLPLEAGNLSGSTQATIVAWMNPISVSNSGGIFTHSYNGFFNASGPLGIIFSISSLNQLWSSLYLGQSSSAAESVPVGRWSQVAMVFDGTEAATNRIRFFQNGKPLNLVALFPSDIPNHISSLITDTIIGAEDVSWDFFHGSLDEIRIYNRALPSDEIQQLFANESQPVVALRRAVKPVFSNLLVGASYQLQVSGDLKTWTNAGVPFTASSSALDAPQYWDVDDWPGLFLRLEMVP